MTTPPQPPVYGQAIPPLPMSPADEKLWATLVHIGGIFFWFLSPLIGYLVLKDRGPFVRAHTMTALNFQITLVIASVAGGVLSFIGVGGLLIFAAYVLNIVFSIIAAVKANQGQWYSYPVAIPFIK
ncbi:DUF4870 domain-containing protein [Microbacterium sp. BWT-B31]|uniref:DUF4870 domain-containing protein n=1 Tax=Microbacterium sp. BWT-B31 TaxID=3232072 RepID=UPI003528200C